MGFFVHGWSWSSALELRAENDGKYNITPTRIYPRQRLIPELRRSGYGKQLPDVTPFDLIHLLLSENKAERDWFTTNQLFKLLKKTTVDFFQIIINLFIRIPKSKG